MVATEQATTQEREALRWADPAEARTRFNDLAERLAGVSGDEFIRRWEDGYYRDVADTVDNRRLVRLAMLIPFGRPDS